MNTPRNQGFAQIAIIAIIIFSALVYFKVDLHGLTQNITIQKIIDVFVHAWNNFIVPMGKYLWTNLSDLIPSNLKF